MAETTNPNSGTTPVRRVVRRPVPLQGDQILMKVSDKQVSTDVYHQIMKCASEFTRMSINIPNTPPHSLANNYMTYNACARYKKNPKRI